MLWVFDVFKNHHLDKQVLKASKALHEGNGHVHFKTHLDEQSLDRLKHCWQADCRQTPYGARTTILKIEQKVLLHEACLPGQMQLKTRYLENRRVTRDVGFREKIIKFAQSVQFRCRHDSYQQVAAENIVKQPLKGRGILYNKFTLSTANSNAYKVTWVYSYATAFHIPSKQ